MSHGVWCLVFVKGLPAFVTVDPCESCVLGGQVCKAVVSGPLILQQV